MKRYIILILSICNSIYYTHAQQATNFDIIRGEIDTLFSKIEKDRIPTGLLLDNAIEHVDIRDYNGQITSNKPPINLSTFIDILKTINSASVHGNIIPSTQFPLLEYNVIADNSNNIHICAALFRYNYIRSDALEDNYISFDGKHIYDVYENGIWKNPYNEEFVFAMASNYIVSKSSIVNFNISLPLIYRNINPKAVYFDADNGMGYRLISNIQNGQITATYRSDGLKTIKLRVEFSNGQTLDTQCNIHINTKLKASQLSQDETLPSFKIEDNGQIVAEVFYCTRNLSGNHRKQFIIVEGFDPWELMNFTRNGEGKHQTYNDLKVYNGYTNYHEAFSNLSHNILSNYDLFYVDWYNSTLDITKNAEYLIEIINQINEQKKLYGNTETNVIMGQSMGGLIARYALCKMERDNIKHQVTTYISHDSPHLGANIPIGAQYFIPQILSFAGGYKILTATADLISEGKLSESAEIPLNILHSTGARQMLINYIDPEGRLDNSTHFAWQKTLESIGFPKGDDGLGIEKLAIVNGAEFTINDNFVNNKHLLKIDGYAASSFWSSLIINMLGSYATRILRLINFDYLLHDIYLPGNSEIRLTAEVNPYLSNTYKNTLSKLNLHYTKYFLWIKSLKIQYDIFNSQVDSPINDAIACDDYNGSFYSLDFSGFNHEDSGWAGSYGLNIELADQIMFIPTTSALAIGESVTNTNKDKIYSDTTLIERTPFDAYYFRTNYSDKHIAIDINCYDWIHDHVNSYISGPDFIDDCGDYCIEGIDKQVHWKVSDESIATIDYNSGHLTALKGGTITVEASILDNGKLYRKTKKVNINFPNFAITKKYVFGQGYQFTAKIINEQDYSEFNEFINNGIIKYEWYIIDKTGNLTTYTDIGDTLYYDILEDEIITIGLKLVYNENLSSNVKTVTLNLQTPFEINYKYVAISRYGTVYYVKSDDTYDIDTPSEDLAITFRHIILDQTDDIFNLVNKYIGGTNCYLGYNDYLHQQSKIINGTKIKDQYKWVFPFYDTDVFTQSLIDATNFVGTNHPIIISDLNMAVFNSNFEKVQNTPFTILYNPEFPLFELNI